jgi:hypothetical protein
MPPAVIAVVAANPSGCSCTQGVIAVPLQIPSKSISVISCRPSKSSRDVSRERTLRTVMIAFCLLVAPGWHLR